MSSFYSSFSTSVSSFSCSYSPPPSPPPAFGASATIPTTPKPLRKELTADSVITQTPPKITTPTNAPPAPKKQSQTQSPKDILREAMKHMNEEHPEGNIMNILHPMAYGTPYPGYDDEDFDENEPLDEEELSEEELSEEELDRIIERSREDMRERKYKHRF